MNPHDLRNAEEERDDMLAVLGGVNEKIVDYETQLTNVEDRLEAMYTLRDRLERVIDEIEDFLAEASAEREAV